VFGLIGGHRCIAKAAAQILRAAVLALAAGRVGIGSAVRPGSAGEIAVIGIELDKVCFIIVKARQLDVKEAATQDDPSGSNMSDDNMIEVLSDDAEDATEIELRSIIDDLNVDEQARLVALSWVGRGDFSREEWADAVRLAHERHTGSTSRYLLGMPLLPDYLDEGLAAFELSCVGEESEPELPEGAPGIRREPAGSSMPIRRRGSAGSGGTS
jgi:Protein of unknown function (DUF3775)